MRAPPVQLQISRVPTPDILGRERELDALFAELATPGIRLVTLTGPGGIGKTTLARTVPGTRSDATFVDASTAGSPDELAERLVGALGWDRRAQPATQRLKARLPNHAGLLILDNLEQVQGAAETVQQWLDLAPNVTWLVTSREALGVPGERLLAVQPLDVPPLDVRSEAEVLRAPAGELFLRHARRVNPQFTVDAGVAGDITRLCRHLDGLPLAIELTAVRMDLFTPGAALQWLEGGQMLPGLRRPGTPERHFSVAHAVRWSYDLLAPELQRALRQLAVFGGDFSPGAAAAVLESDEHDVRRWVRELEGKALLRAAPGERFVLFQTVRAAARRLLREAGEAEQVQVRHAAYHAHLAANAEFGFQRDPARGLRLLHVETTELRSALTFLTDHPAEGRTELALQLAGGIASPWCLLGRVAEAKRLLHRVLELPDGRVAGRARCKKELGWILLSEQRAEAALHLLESAVRALRDEGEGPLLASALATLSEVLRASRRMDDALTAAREALALHARVGGPGAQMVSLITIARILRVREDFEGAREHLTRAVSVGERGDDILNLGGALNTLATVQWDLGDHAGTRDSLERALVAVRRTGDRTNELTILMNLGEIYLHTDDIPVARTRLEEALRLGMEFFDTPDYPHLAGTRGRYAALLVELGEFPEAAAQAREAAGTFGRLGLGQARAVAEVIEAAALVASGHPDAALRMLNGCLPAALADPSGEADRVLGLVVLGRAAHRLRGPAVAARALGAAREALGAQFEQPTFVRRWYMQLERQVREELTEAGFLSEWAAGRTMPVQDLLDELLPPDGPEGPDEGDLRLLALLARNLTNREIAAELKRSPNTVRNRLSALYARHAVGGREALLALARDRGWL